MTITKEEMKEILDYNSYQIGVYIENSIKKPLEEWNECDYGFKKLMMKELIKDPWECYKYAYDIIKKPWEENDYWGEEIKNIAIESIKKDKYAFFLYKKNICEAEYNELLIIAIENFDYIVRQEDGFDELLEMLIDNDVPKDEDVKAKHLELKNRILEEYYEA